MVTTSSVFSLQNYKGIRKLFLWVMNLIFASNSMIFLKFEFLAFQRYQDCIIVLQSKKVMGIFAMGYPSDLSKL